MTVPFLSPSPHLQIEYRLRQPLIHPFAALGRFHRNSTAGVGAVMLIVHDLALQLIMKSVPPVMDAYADVPLMNLPLGQNLIAFIHFPRLRLLQLHAVYARN